MKYTNYYLTSIIINKINRLQNISNISVCQANKKQSLPRQTTVTEELEIARSQFLQSVKNDAKITVLQNIQKEACRLLEEGKPLPLYNKLINILGSYQVMALAYSNISRNKGALTPGTNPEDTTDGITKLLLENLALSVRDGSFEPTPIRRVYIPKPEKTAKRPLGIPDFYSKLVQEGIRMILDAIYDPIMEKQSANFGFRKNKSPHDALVTIDNKGQGLSYAIEGDIKGAYDNVNHDILLRILGKRITDKKFLNLIKNFCKAGIFDSLTKSYQDSLLGVPQGGIASPILFNIYMMEFDDFVLKFLSQTIESINNRQFRGQTKKSVSKYYYSIRNKYYVSRNKYGMYISSKNKPISHYSTEELLTLQNLEIERNLLKNKLLSTAYTDYSRKPLSILYVRYADDWILLTNGKLSLTTLLRNKISSYLKTYLNLELSQEKTKITNILNDNAYFLGFQIRGYNPSRISQEGKQRVGRTIHFFPDHERILNRLFINGYCDRDGFPREKPAFSQLNVEKIITKYNSMMIGLSNYYLPIITFKSSINRYHYILHYSAIKTLAQKHSTSIGGIFDKYGSPMVYNYEIDNKPKKYILYNFEIWKQKSLDIYENFLQHRKTKRKLYLKMVDSDFLKRYKINWRTKTKLTGRCLICGSNLNIQMHHVKHIRKGETSGFTSVMQALNRKQVPLCADHHKFVHSGEYDGLSISELYDTRIATIENQLL